MTHQGIEADRQRIYAIGDIHGRLDLLDPAIEAIGRDVAERGSAALTVTIGDYIDRGPQSRGVVDRLVDNPFGMPFVALKGTTEDTNTVGLERSSPPLSAQRGPAAANSRHHPRQFFALAETLV